VFKNLSPGAMLGAEVATVSVLLFVVLIVGDGDDDGIW